MSPTDREHPDSRQAAYTAAGVDTAAASRGLDGLLSHLRQTFAERPAGPGHALLDFGHYAGLIDLGGGQALAIATDGVGSKILVAEMLERYDTLGIDLIAMNANDLVCIGAEPLAMVDYIATERLDGAVLAQIGAGLRVGASQARITIPAGEIAQLPEMIRGTRAGSGIDLVGTCVGTVRTDKVITGERAADGDVLIALASSGLHSNGYTLVRKVLLDQAGLALDRPAGRLGRPLGDELLEPTRIYVRAALDMIDAVDVKAMAHITGDGLLNLLRLHPGMSYDLTELPAPPAIFELVAEHGGIAPREMYEVFNMGIGFAAVVDANQADTACGIGAAHGIESLILGRAADDGRAEVRLEPLGIALGSDRASEAAHEASVE